MDVTHEESSLEAAKTEDIIITSKSVTESVDTTRQVIGRGRPKTKPDSKPAIFHLSLELISLIEKEANEKMMGNKSALVTKIFSDYFASKVL